MTAAVRARTRPLRRTSATRLLIYAALVAAAIFYLLPIYVLLVTGLKSFREVSLAAMWDLPRELGLASFVKAWAGDPATGFTGLADNFANSLLMAVPATLISSVLGSLNGYVFAKWRFPGSNVLFSAFLIGLFIPYQSVLIPLVVTLQKMHLYGSIPGLVFVHVVYGIPITTLIFRNYYATVPGELIEAAKIDGASLLGIYRWILFPISVPAFVVTLIWQFTSIWNDFLFGVIVTSRPSVQPITVALNNLAGSFVVEWNVQMAGALIAALPTLLLYIFLGRYFVRGLMAGSIKG